MATLARRIEAAAWLLLAVAALTLVPCALLTALAQWAVWEPHWLEPVVLTLLPGGGGGLVRGPGRDRAAAALVGRPDRGRGGVVSPVAASVAERASVGRTSHADAGGGARAPGLRAEHLDGLPRRILRVRRAGGRGGGGRGGLVFHGGAAVGGRPRRRARACQARQKACRCILGDRGGGSPPFLCAWRDRPRRNDSAVALRRIRPG